MPRKKPATSLNPTLFSPKGLQRQVSTDAQKNWQEDTILYGDDDSLPLRIAKAVSESPATSACVSTVGKYIKGSGFSNKALENIIIDKNGTTLWQLHCMLSDSLALFDGFTVNFKFDSEGKITATYPMSFESCRLKKPDDSGNINEIVYNPYFGTAEYKKKYSQYYPAYDPKQVLNQIQEGKVFKGQVYYYGKTTPLFRFYPVPDYWSAKKWIEVDGKIQEFHAENLSNGFFQSVLLNVIGDPSQPSNNPKYTKTYTDESGVKRKEVRKTIGEEFNEMMQSNFSGSTKAGTALALWSNTQDTAVKIQPFSNNSNSDLFIALQDLSTKNITIATQVPGILANISEGVNLGSGGSEIQKAIELMHSRVIEEQKTLCDFYNKVLLPNLATPVNATVEIVNFVPITTPTEIDDKYWDFLNEAEKIAFIKKNVNGIEIIRSTPVTPTETPTETSVETTLEQQPDNQVNEALKTLNIADINKIQKIVARFNLSKSEPDNSKALTYDQAKQILASYGFTDEQINAWLVTEDEL